MSYYDESNMWSDAREFIVQTHRTVFGMKLKLPYATAEEAIEIQADIDKELACIVMMDGKWGYDSAKGDL